MMGNKTLAEIRADLRTQGIDMDQLHRELTELYEQPRRDKQSARILNDLLKSLKTKLSKRTAKRRVTAKSGKGTP